MVFEIIGLGLLLILSGFFSSSELAFIVSNNIKIEVRARNKKFAARCAYYFVKNPQIFYSTILISNNIVNIAFASLLTLLLVNLFGLNDFGILICSSTLLLIFGELLPKYFAREFADNFVLISSVPLRFITFLLYPLAKLTSSISDVFIKSNNQAEAEISKEIEKEDLQSLVDESSQTGSIAQDDSDMFNKIIELGEIKVNETMTPRTDIVGASIDSSIDDILKIFINSGYSKVPVYEENLDNIKGVIFTNEMFDNPTNIKSIIKPIKFIPETKRAIDMLNQFLREQISIAIVVDEFGGTEGLVTVEDIIEEMFGEIHDEYDTEENISKEIGKSTYLFSGKAEIDLINEQFGINILEGEYETIAGYITTSIGRIPDQSEKIEIDNFKINILRSDKTKINLVRLYKLEELSEE